MGETRRKFDKDLREGARWGWAAAEPLVTGEREVTVSQPLAASDDLGRAAPSS